MRDPSKPEWTPGLFSGSRSARAIHTGPGKQSRFPYYPSRYERRIFKYVFFSDRSFGKRQFERLQLFAVCMAALLNVSSVTANVWATWYNSDEMFSSMGQLCVAFVSIVEAVVIIYCLLGALNFSARLVQQSLSSTSSNAVAPETVGGDESAPLRGEEDEKYFKERAYPLFCARCLSYWLKQIGDWHLLQLVRELQPRSVQLESINSDSLRPALPTTLHRITIPVTVV